MEKKQIAIEHSLKRSVRQKRNKISNKKLKLENNKSGLSYNDNTNNISVKSRHRLKNKKLRKRKSNVLSGNDSELEDNLKHLRTVNTETTISNMNLDYDVLVDKRMMFDIPYIKLHSNDLSSFKSDDEVEQYESNTRNIKKKLSHKRTSLNISKDISVSDQESSCEGIRRSSRKKVSFSSDEVIILEDEIKAKKPSHKNTHIENERRSKSENTSEDSYSEINDSFELNQESKEEEIIVENSSSKKAFAKQKTKYVSKSKMRHKLKPNLRKQKLASKIDDDNSYKCFICKKEFVFKCDKILHELEHNISFSPYILINNTTVEIHQPPREFFIENETEDKPEEDNVETSDKTEVKEVAREILDKVQKVDNNDISEEAIEEINTSEDIEIQNGKIEDETKLDNIEETTENDICDKILEDFEEEIEEQSTAEENEIENEICLEELNTKQLQNEKCSNELPIELVDSSQVTQNCEDVNDNNFPKVNFDKENEYLVKRENDIETIKNVCHNEEDLKQVEKLNIASIENSEKTEESCQELLENIALNREETDPVLENEEHIVFENDKHCEEIIDEYNKMPNLISKQDELNEDNFSKDLEMSSKSEGKTEDNELVEKLENDDVLITNWGSGVDVLLKNPELTNKENVIEKGKTQCEFSETDSTPIENVEKNLALEDITDDEFEVILDSTQKTEDQDIPENMVSLIDCINKRENHINNGIVKPNDNIISNLDDLNHHETSVHFDEPKEQNVGDGVILSFDCNDFGNVEEIEIGHDNDSDSSQKLHLELDEIGSASDNIDTCIIETDNNLKNSDKVKVNRTGDKYKMVESLLEGLGA